MSRQKRVEDADILIHKENSLGQQNRLTIERKRKKSNGFLKRFLAVFLASFFYKRKRRKLLVHTSIFCFLLLLLSIPPVSQKVVPDLLWLAAVFLPYRFCLRVAASLHSMR